MKVLLLRKLEAKSFLWYPNSFAFLRILSLVFCATLGLLFNALETVELFIPKMSAISCIVISLLSIFNKNAHYLFIYFSEIVNLKNKLALSKYKIIKIQSIVFWCFLLLL